VKEISATGGKSVAGLNIVETFAGPVIRIIYSKQNWRISYCATRWTRFQQAFAKRSNELKDGDNLCITALIFSLRFFLFASSAANILNASASSIPASFAMIIAVE